MAKANIANTLVVPTETTVFPYYDDFNEEKGFYRILFRPGYAVQARELTQLQTILQNQIERFGRHIFTNGSMVIGGEVYFPPNNYATINLNPAFANTNIDVNVFDKKVITSVDEANTIQFRVVSVTGATPTEPPVIYGNYITVDQFDDNQTFVLKGSSNTFANTATANSATLSRFAGIKDSIFFYNGFFVKVPAQVAVIGKYDLLPSCRVGLELDDSIVSEQSDSSLLDPAQESFNYQAPGAARYKIDLILTSRTLDSEDDSKFIELARIEDGNIKSLVKYPIYSEIEEVFARRTYDESGNYTVRPFNISLENNKRDPDNMISAILSPGKGYVFGYEIETIGTTELPIKKGRTLERVDAYDLNMNYGNYVIVDNMRGLFDTSVMDVFDIHCTSWGNVNYSNTQTYNTTKIGYGRVKDIEFFGGDIDVDARKYEFYLLDTNFINISSNIAYSDNTTVIRLFANNLTTNISNTYDGAILKIVNGPGSGYTHTIESYNGTTKEIVLKTPLFEDLGPTTNVSVEFSFLNADSFIKRSPYTSGATSNAFTNISTLNKSGNRSNGTAFISESSLNTLIFTLPDRYIAYGVNGIANTSYSYRKKFETTFSFGSSVPIQVETNENFIGATASSNIASTIMENFMIICTDKKASARANGDVIKATVSISGTPEQAVFNTGNTDPNDSFSATIFAKVDFDIGVPPKQKILHLMNDRNISSNTPVMLYNSSTRSTSNVYLPDGQVVISNPIRKVGVPESLYVSDVLAIKIYDLNGEPLPAPGDDITMFNDVTNRFDIDFGQRENFYDHASIKLRPNFASCRGPLLVCCRYYEHSPVSAGGGGFFTVDSYPSLNTAITDAGTNIGDGYSIIPQIQRSNGDLIELRDCIDFRPTRQNGTNTAPNFTLQGAQIPLPTTDFELDYKYYLGRRDIIALDKSRQFLVIEGIPSKVPVEPTAPATAMVLYTLNVPPYTEYPSNVIVRFIDNKRYTMRDIGKIDKRVENLEYYVSLNTLEKNALDLIIPDVDGIDRTKYGVFVDDFKSHVLGNPSSSDYACAMNFIDGWLQCQNETVGVKLRANSSLSSDIRITKDKIVLNYVEVEYLSQTSATKFSPVAEFLYSVFEGNIIMSPEADIWYSTTQTPDIIVTDQGVNQLTINNIYQSIVNSQKR
jgi:hypothetical protein